MKQIKKLKVKCFKMREKYNNILNSRLAQNKSYIEKELKKILSDIDCAKTFKRSNVVCGIKWRKRIRPFIISEVSSLYQVGSSIYKYPSMAIEMAHCFSLIYDDLPCMDDDDLRRGSHQYMLNLMKLMLYWEVHHY